MPAKEPPRLLGRKEIEALTGFGKKKVLALFRHEWNVPGGTKLIGDEYRVTEAFYTRWVEGRDVAAPKGKESAHA